MIARRRSKAEGENRIPFCFWNLYFSVTPREILFLGLSSQEKEAR
jgi:hypothetical protein